MEEEEEEDKPKTKKVEKTVHDWELLNETKPVWQRPAKEITDSEYAEFFKSISKVCITIVVHLYNVRTTFHLIKFTG